MSRSQEHVTPVDTILHTRESANSRQKVEEELKVQDPENGRAVAVLKGEEEEGAKDESTGS